MFLGFMGSDGCNLNRRKSVKCSEQSTAQVRQRNDMLSIHDLYESDYRTKLDLAKGLHLSLHEQINTEPIRLSLALLTGMAKDLSLQMSTMNFGRICSKCAGQPNGGCCAKGFICENDAIQLLMNLMADVSVVFFEGNDKECLYLGESGCILSFKPFFCLNYDCQSIKGCASDEGTGRYDLMRGTLLCEQWRLEQLLLDRLAFLGELKLR